jgi:glycosyltransferase involved in cell wall biosynthesis
MSENIYGDLPKMEEGRETIRVLLISPLPPPAGGIATWTKILLGETQKYPSVQIKHIDVAVRWKTAVNRSHILQLVGGSLQALRDIVRVMMAMTSFRPHVLHLTSSAGYASLKDVVIMLLVRMFGKAGLIHYHTSRIAGYQHTCAWQFHAAVLAMRLATTVVVLDKKTYACLQKVLSPKKLAKIPNMIALDKIDKLVLQAGISSPARPNSDAVHLVFVGRVVPEKGLVEQVEACAQLERLQLHLVGPVADKFRKYLEHLAQRQPRGQWLHFYGAVDHEEACRHILRSDILLLPSHDEAFPNTVLEGMALAKPVVVSNVGAMTEMIDTDGENDCGVCVEPGNSASLRAGLKSLLARPESWPTIGQKGRKRVEALYTPGPIMKQLIDLWTDMASTGLSKRVFSLPNRRQETFPPRTSGGSV